jgi:small-conductance mechanosensitive channel
LNFGVVIDALTQIIVDIINFIPDLINGLIILIVGYAIAVAVRWLLGTVLRRVRFDPLVERTGITGALRGLGVRTPLSTIIAQTIFALLLISFLITSTRLMGLEAVAQLLERLLLFLPNIIAALIVFLLGGIAAQFTGNLVTTLATGGGLAYGARMGRLVQYLLSVFVVIFALGVLGIDTSILVTALTIALAAFGLAIGLSLGLGARGIVAHVLAGYYIRQRFAVGQRVVLGQVEGDLSSVGGVNTVLATPGGATVVPNTTVLESITRVPQTPQGDSTPERS